MLVVIFEYSCEEHEFAFRDSLEEDFVICC